MEQIYYGIALVVYAIFIVRFILSWIGGDFELDADTDLDVSDVVSFKGLTHFLMGSTGWLSVKSLITHNIMWYDYLIAFMLGVIFVIILYFVYKFLMTLESKPGYQKGTHLVGYTVKIYACVGKDGEYYKYSAGISIPSGTMDLATKSKTKYNIGDVATISGYENAYYII